MRKIAHLWISWADRYGQPRKTAEQLARDKQRVREALERAGYGHLFSEEGGSYLIDVEASSKEFGILVEELQKDPHLIPPGGLDIRQFHSRQELEAAELLIWGPTNQTIEDDYYDLHKNRDTEEIGSFSERCVTCGARLQQIRELMVNKTLMGKRDFSLTYSDQVVLAERVGRLVQEHRLTGFDLWPVHHYKKPYKGEPTLYQLRVTHQLPPMASPPTEFEQFHHCDVCGRTSRFLKHTHWWGKIQYYDTTDVYYPRSVLAVVKDLSGTAEYFGELVVSHPYIIISQRVYRLLREHKVKNWAAVPVYLVD
jgi:hypothetical protein